MTYTHLLFDLDGTLFDFDAGETYAFHKVCDTFHIPYSDEVLSLLPDFMIFLLLLAKMVIRL